MISILHTVDVISWENREFIESLYQKHYGMIVLTIRVYTTETDIHDIIQDSVVRIIEYTDTLKNLEEKAQLQYIIRIVQSITIKTLEKSNQQFRSEYTGDFLETMLNLAADYTNQPETIVEKPFLCFVSLKGCGYDK